MSIHYEQITLSDKISFIQSPAFCEAVVKSPLYDFDEVCGGDCECCRINHIDRLLKDIHDRLKRLLVPCDKNIRYKVDKPTFDEILEELNTEETA